MMADSHGGDALEWGKRAVGDLLDPVVVEREDLQAAQTGKRLLIDVRDVVCV